MDEHDHRIFQRCSSGSEKSLKNSDLIYLYIYGPIIDSHNDWLNWLSIATPSQRSWFESPFRKKHCSANFLFLSFIFLFNYISTDRTMCAL